MSIYTEIAEDAIARIRAAQTAADVVPVYTELLLRIPTATTQGWVEINRAILDRWKPSTLNRIKREAWKAAQ